VTNVTGHSDPTPSGERRSSGLGAAAPGSHIAAGKGCGDMYWRRSNLLIRNILLFPIETIYCTRVFCDPPMAPVS
jgi:hypothetical protein